jgi:ABC-type lipoprotein release transport system permease subunit
MLNDLRYAARVFARTPGYTAAALLSLAIAIGANAAIFSVINALLFRPLAGQLWPDRDPIGKRVRSGGLNSTSPWLTVVGVVGRVKQYTLDVDSRIAFYFPQTQVMQRGMNVVVRGRDPAALTSAVRGEIHAIDPDLPLYDVRTMEQRVEASLATRRFSMMLLGVFALVALALATIGVYGVIAYLVNQSTREIGIRIAMGATQRGIVGLVVRRGMTLAIVGVAIGLAGAFAVTRFLSSFLFGVRTTDPITFVAIALLMMTAALLASLIPARRAARIDPIVSLRCE